MVLWMSRRSIKNNSARWALAPINVLYGIYALIVWCLCLFVGGALVLTLPGLTLRRRVARRALRIMFALSLMPYRFDDLDKLPDGPCVVIANHRSYLDGLVLIAALPPRFKPVIKQEIAAVPVIGTVLKRVGSGFVQRQPPMKAGRDTLDLLAALQDGESLAIFPEGSFSPDPGLLPFRSGAFLMAAKADVPVVPVVMRGTRAVLPEGHILPRPARVSIHVLEPAEPAGDDREAAGRLRDRVEESLSETLKARSAETGAEGDDLSYYREVFSGRPLPLAYLDLDIFERNIRTIVERSGAKNVRADGRVLRCPDLIERIMRSNARFNGAMCATAEEAIHLAREKNVRDTLVAYPTTVGAALDRVCEAIAEGHAITLSVDSRAHVAALSQAAERADVTVRVCVEMDTSASVLNLKGPSRRTPIRTTVALLNIVSAIADTPRLTFRGILLFDARRNPLTESARRSSGRRQAPASGKKAIARLRQRREAVVEALRSHGYPPDIVACDGHARMEANAQDGSVTDITVGAAFFGLDRHDPHDTPAAGFALEAMRQPSDTLYACLSGGYTAADCNDFEMLPRPYLPRGAELDPLFGAGEDQLPIRYDGELSVGDTIFMHPVNASELCDRFGRLLLVQEGMVVDEVDTYRALGDQFVHAGSGR